MEGRGREESSTARFGRVRGGTAGRLVSAVLVASAATVGEGLIAAAAAAGGGGGGGSWRGSPMLSAGRRGGAAALRWRAGRAAGGESKLRLLLNMQRCATRLYYSV